MIQSSFTGAESEKKPKTAGRLAQSAFQVPQSNLDVHAILVAGSHLPAWLLLPWYGCSLASDIFTA